MWGHMKKNSSIWIIFLLPLFSISQALSAHEKPAKVFASDCTDVQLEPIDPSKLTKEERIKMLEASLFESIDKTTDCMRKAQDSMASSMTQGLNSSHSSNTSAGANNELESEQSEQVDESNTPITEPASGDNSGSKNHNIAEQDNDKRICMALKDDVDNEKDPQKQAELAKELKSYSMCNKYF